MAIYLHEKYASKIDKKFSLESISKGRFTGKVDFTGVKTVRITTPQTVPLVDYKRSGTNRYGDPKEMQDTVQEMTLTQDKSFAMTIDKGNNTDQGALKAAGKMLALEIQQECVPALDKYVFERVANLAGTIVGNATALSKSNICDRVTKGVVALDNAEVPAEGRSLFVPPDVYALLRLSPEFIGVDKLAEKSLSKGEVGEFAGMAVIKVPTGRWPKNVNFVIAHKSAVIVAEKLNDTKLHTDPPGISGNLLEGRMYYDCFVFEQKAGAVYAEVNTASGGGSIVEAPTITAATGALASSTSGATIYYTTDGSDPRYSANRKSGTSASGGAGTVVKAYAEKAGMFPSAVVTETLTA